MKFNVANKTPEQIDQIINAYATAEQANLMGFASLLPLIEGDVLELAGVGVYVEPEKAPTAPSDFCKKSDKEIAYLNSFAA